MNEREFESTLEFELERVSRVDRIKASSWNNEIKSVVNELNLLPHILVNISFAIKEYFNLILK